MCTVAAYFNTEFNMITELSYHSLINKYELLGKIWASKDEKVVRNILDSESFTFRKNNNYNCRDLLRIV